MKITTGQLLLIGGGLLALAAPALASQGGGAPAPRPEPEREPAPAGRPQAPSVPGGFTRVTPPKPVEVAQEVGDFLLGSAELFGKIAPALFGGLGAGAGSGSGGGNTAPELAGDPFAAFRMPSSPNP